VRRSPIIPILVLCCAGCKVTSTKRTQSVPEQGTVEWHVQQAKAKGETKVSLAQFPGMGQESNLDQALEYSTIVSAIPISSAVQIGKDTIFTWYKFKIMSFLSKAERCDPPCNSAPIPPSSLLPLAPDEIAIPFGGGTAVVDGVTVTVSAERSHFKANEKYILFLDSSADSSQVFFLGGGGHQWAFKVEGRGELYDESFRSSQLAQQVMTLHTEERLSKYMRTIALKPPGKKD
jgi:hypothetical protein